MAAYIGKNVTNNNPYSVGNRIYGGGRSFPNIGKSDPIGYRERDALLSARKNAILRRMKAQQKGNLFSADALRSV